MHSLINRGLRQNRWNAKQNEIGQKQNETSQKQNGISQKQNETSQKQNGRYPFEIVHFARKNETCQKK